MEEAIYVLHSHPTMKKTLSIALQKEIFYHSKASFNLMTKFFQFRATFIYKTGIVPNNNNKNVLAHAGCQTVREPSQRKAPLASN